MQESMEEFWNDFLHELLKRFLVVLLWEFLMEYQEQFLNKSMVDFLTNTSSKEHFPCRLSSGFLKESMKQYLGNPMEIFLEELRIFLNNYLVDFSMST